MGPSARLFGLALSFMICAAPAGAVTTSAHGFLITVEPIVGYEYSNRNEPVQHKAGTLVYGARFSAGRPHLALEGEYTRGSDTQVFPLPTRSVLVERENLLVGGRASYSVLSHLDAALRFGGQASKGKTTITETGVNFTTVDDRGWQIKPYLGAGLQVLPQQFVSLSLEATYVFYSLSDWTQNTVRYSGGVRFKFNSK